MKFTKLSLIVALAVSSAFAADAKIGGDAKLFYSTTDAGSADLFNKSGAIGDAAFNLTLSKDVATGVTANVGVTGVSTLGLENDLVSGTWVNHNGGVDDQVWIDTANLTAKVANTTIVAGRQKLDTPFFTSETWNIAPNTFDAIVAVNQDIPDTTLVGAWVGRGNGDAAQTVRAQNVGGGFKPFTGASKPAYAFALVNKSLKDVTAQAWYYAIPTIAKAYWLQADTNVQGIELGLQYANAKLNSSSDNTNAIAAKVGYSKDNIAAFAAYSQRNDKAGIDISNIATGHSAASQSSLYTEAWWNYGIVGSQDAKAISVGGSYDLGSAKLSLQHTNVDTGANNKDIAETSFVIDTKVGPLNASMAFINTSADEDARDGNTVQAYLTVPFSL